MRILLVGALLALGPANLFAQSPDPGTARIVTSDLHNFWRAYERLERSGSLQDSMRAVFEEYYLPGSPGLHDFIRARIGSVLDLLDVMARHPRYYASMRAETDRAGGFEPQIRRIFQRFEELYPDAVFADVYLLIGRMNSGGTTSPDKILIGTEMYGRTAETPEDELGDWHRQVLRSGDVIPAIVAHELIHVNQRHPDGPGSVLSAAIREGAADFLGELISGGNINDHIHRWADPRERELWEEFQRDMGGRDYSRWFASDDPEARPKDLGYYIGHKIVEAYYRRSDDKVEAIHQILTISDFDDFLARSRYADRFESSEGKKP